MTSEYAYWAERNKRQQKRKDEYRLAKPMIKLLRCEDGPWWMCDSLLQTGQRGYGKTPTEAYEAWFNDSIPF